MCLQQKTLKQKFNVIDVYDDPSIVFGVCSPFFYFILKGKQTILNFFLCPRAKTKLQQKTD